MKGSLQTFLNAFTYPDRTCYPVSEAYRRRRPAAAGLPCSLSQGSCCRVSRAGCSVLLCL
jgi:hypothetical protein